MKTHIEMKGQDGEYDRPDASLIVMLCGYVAVLYDNGLLVGDDFYSYGAGDSATCEECRAELLRLRSLVLLAEVDG